jgi:CNT family concentrative nucleoside transporter
MYPEVGDPVTKGDMEMQVEQTNTNGIDAAATGAKTGLILAANVGGMLLAFIALLAMGNHFMESFGSFTGINAMIPEGSLTIEKIMGWIIAPFAYIIGVPWADAINIGSLLGIKVVLNEFLAYTQLSEMVNDGILTDKTITMATFALCGFANFSSIAIQIGGIGGLAPSRKSELAQFGLKAVLAGTLANLMTATIAGMLY